MINILRETGYFISIPSPDLFSYVSAFIFIFRIVLLLKAPPFYKGWLLHNASRYNKCKRSGDILPHSNMMVKPDSAVALKRRATLIKEGELMNGIHYDLICLSPSLPQRFSGAAGGAGREDSPSCILLPQRPFRVGHFETYLYSRNV